ncbi:MAG: zinc-ribbon domain-containing protein [Deltaproteobacteria bacterium]|nr:zinc-ribbon domain-containing protein [Deltaproteobacteria bacterium]
MEVTCEHCKTRLNIPDEKLPRDQAVKLSCPKCKQKITIDLRKEEPQESPPLQTEEHGETGKFHLRFIESQKEEERGGEGYSYSDYSDDKALDFFEEGTKLALVMPANPEQGEGLRASVEQLGYKCIPTASTRDAVGKLRFHHFDLILLSDGFDGQPIDRSPILTYLNRVSMSVRRRIFVALLSDQFKSMDHMMAFSMSANAVVATKDVDRLSQILKKAISDNEKFYKVFQDTLVDVGKA